MKKSLTLLFILGCYQFLFSDQGIKEKGFDVLKYKLDISIDMNSGKLSGENTITFLALKDLNKIYFHALGLTIQKISMSGQKLNFKLNAKKEIIEIDILKCMKNDTACVNIKYEYDDSFKRKAERRGFYFYKKNITAGIYSDVLENEAYTMSEPSDARCWFPCWDEPNDKVLSEINITVDTGYTAVSNGLIEKVLNLPGGKNTFFWKSSNPISTYLMSFVVSKYSTFSDYFIDEKKPDNKIEIKYYFWKADSNGKFYSAVRTFKNVVKMIKVFSNIFGEYPFEKYGMVAISPFDFGGEEHQTITSIHRYWLYGEENGIAHELAHQWWGDLVTCGNWKDIWLNESFATYCEAIYIEKTESNIDFINKIKSYYRLGKEWESAIYDPEGQGKKLFTDLVYQKGALVLHTLRNTIGDSLFFKTLDTYKEKYRYSYAKTNDFVEIVNKVTGKNMNWFFDQYIYGKGWPKIKYSWEYFPDDKNLKITIRQVQDENWPTYGIPLELKVFGKNQKNITINIDGKNRKQDFIIPLGSAPEKVLLDPEHKVFMQVISN